jgi:hypothetical protein
MTFKVISISGPHVVVEPEPDIPATGISVSVSVQDLGHELMEFEAGLRNDTGQDVEVFLVAQNDMNSLRRFRGVEVA